jgi:DNA-binding HxlR family transcriptional regulator
VGTIITCDSQATCTDALLFASILELCYSPVMIYEAKCCPFRFGLGAFGDRWTLLIIRDMMLFGFTRFQQFLDAGEGISTNVLTDRLNRLEEQGIVSRKKDPDNGRKVIYSLTEKGEDLSTVMLAIFEWSEKHDPETLVPRDFAQRLRTEFFGDPDQMLADLKQAISKG